MANSSASIRKRDLADLPTQKLINEERGENAYISGCRKAQAIFALFLLGGVAIIGCTLGQVDGFDGNYLYGGICLLAVGGIVAFVIEIFIRKAIKSVMALKSELDTTITLMPDLPSLAVSANKEKEAPVDKKTLERHAKSDAEQTRGAGPENTDALVGFSKLSQAEKRAHLIELGSRERMVLLTRWLEQAPGDDPEVEFLLSVIGFWVFLTSQRKTPDNLNCLMRHPKSVARLVHERDFDLVTQIVSRDPATFLNGLAPDCNEPFITAIIRSAHAEQTFSTFVESGRIAFASFTRHPRTLSGFIATPQALRGVSTIFNSMSLLEKRAFIGILSVDAKRALLFDWLNHAGASLAGHEIIEQMITCVRGSTPFAVFVLENANRPSTIDGLLLDQRLMERYLRAISDTAQKAAVGVLFLSKMDLEKAGAFCKVFQTADEGCALLNQLASDHIRARLVITNLMNGQPLSTLINGSQEALRVALRRHPTTLASMLNEDASSPLEKLYFLAFFYQDESFAKAFELQTLLKNIKSDDLQAGKALLKLALGEVKLHPKDYHSLVYHGATTLALKQELPKQQLVAFTLLHGKLLKGEAEPLLKIIDLQAQLAKLQSGETTVVVHLVRILMGECSFYNYVGSMHTLFLKALCLHPHAMAALYQADERPVCPLLVDSMDDATAKLFLEALAKTPSYEVAVNSLIHHLSEQRLVNILSEKLILYPRQLAIRKPSPTLVKYLISKMSEAQITQFLKDLYEADQLEVFFNQRPLDDHETLYKILVQVLKPGFMQKKEILLLMIPMVALMDKGAVFTKLREFIKFVESVSATSIAAKSLGQRIITTIKALSQKKPNIADIMKI